MDLHVPERHQCAKQPVETINELELKNVMMDQMMALDVQLVVEDGLLDIHVQEELQQPKILVSHVELHVQPHLGLLGVEVQEHQLLLAALVVVTPKQALNLKIIANQHVEMVKLNAMKNVKMETKSKMMVVQTNANFLGDMGQVKHESHLLTFI